ncbi:unnamed protein product [Cuscuta epithymum]|uniref:Exocyst subunit Exo70 family protein n=1 Tax=Cuscuta epithymum TaxID=186058 RepID=A0AAV0DGG3_9ASTE|nr:unnamed protein product [Cuscuta epithymum]
MERIRAARETLRCCLEASKVLSSNFDIAGETLEKTSQRLDFLETSITKISTKCNLYNKIKDPLDCAIHLSVSIPSMFQLLCGLEDSLLYSHPSYGLFEYLNTIKYTQDSLRFFTGYCKLTIPCLEEVEHLLVENNFSIADTWCLDENVNKCLEMVEELSSMEERFNSEGGALFSALDKLETELATLLMDDNIVMEKIQAIIERLAANNRQTNFVSAYVEIRSLNARERLEELGLDYLEMPLTEIDRLNGVENQIYHWGTHLEYAVKYVFETEHNLCCEIFQKNHSEIFLQIVTQSGFQSFFKFGNAIAEGKKEAIKILRLLEIFAVLNKLRPDFNRLFNGKAFWDIQTQTRELMKKVVNGVCETFWELHQQVELQQLPSALLPSNCGVPRLVTLVTIFCNELLEDEYWLTLLQVVEIHQGWNHKEFDEELVAGEIRNIVTALERNLEAWARAYVEPALSCLFLINSHWYISKHTKGTKLGELMGNSWIRKQKENIERFMEAYLKESWGKLADQDDNVSFGKAFERIYESQSGVELCDNRLRWRICEVVLQAVVPPYIEKYESPVDIKYTSERLEQMISSLFKPMVEEFGATKCTKLTSKVNRVIADRVSRTPAAA